MSNSNKYCIGKSEHFRELETVKGIPTAKRDIPDRYNTLLTTIYDTVADAQAAAVEATTYNPVGFVVLLLDKNGVFGLNPDFNENAK